MNQSINICELFISLGHAYFGRHGQEALPYEMHACEAIECVAGKGIMGDRFYSYKDDYKGQITFFDKSVHEAVQNHFSQQIAPSAFRRNVLMSGMPLSQLIGKRFKIGDCIFQGTEHCKPCYWLDHACTEGVENFLAQDGGLRAKIIRSGSLQKGDYLLQIL